MYRLVNLLNKAGMSSIRDVMPRHSSWVLRNKLPLFSPSMSCWMHCLANLQCPSHEMAPQGVTPICRSISSACIIALFFTQILHPMTLFFTTVHTFFSKFQHKIWIFSFSSRHIPVTFIFKCPSPPQMPHAMLVSLLSFNSCEFTVFTIHLH